MKTIEHSTAVITGAGSGIGRHLALQLAERGANLALSDIDQTGLAETVALIDTSAVEVHQQTLDVANKQSVFDYAQTLSSNFTEINILINNAGVALNTGTFENTTLDEFEWLMSINFFGVIYGTKAFLPLLKDASWGHIVNVSSLFGILGVPGQSAYNASKFAVRGFTEALRQELDMTTSSVSCTCVHPGGVKTNIAKNSRASEQPHSLSSQETDGLLIGSAEDFDKIAKTTAESAANQIINAIENNQRRALIGRDAKLLDWVQRHFPSQYPRVFGLLKNALQK